MNNKKLWVKILVTSVLFLMLPLYSFSVTERVFDDAGLFTEAEKSGLEDAIEIAEKKTGLYIAVITTDDIGLNKSDDAVVRYADDYYDRLFGINTDGILFMINNDSANKYDYISTSGKAVDIISESFRYTLFDHIHEHLVNGKFYEASYIFINSTADYITYTADDDNDYTLTYENEFDLSELSEEAVNLLITGLIISLITVIFIILGVRKRYKIHPIISSKNYLNHSSIRYHQSSDVFLRQYVTKTRIKSDNHSGGGSSHRSSGGGHHGGGGRHR